MGLELITPPALEPVDLADACTHLRVLPGTDDAYISSLIVAARMLVEGDTRRALITQTWVLGLEDGWPEDRDSTAQNRDGGSYGYGTGVPSRTWRYRISLPLPPLIAVNGISYVDQLGTVQSLVTNQYQVSKSRTGEWYVEPAFNVAWPQARSQMTSIAINFDCGYGPAGSDVPEPLKVAMKLLMGQWYDHRASLDIIRAGEGELPNAARALVQRYRVMY